MTTDPIADMLTRIKNAYLAGKRSVIIPRSKFKLALAKVLAKNEFIGEIKSGADESYFTVELVYQDGQPALTEVRRVSKPGLRRYMGVSDLALIKQGLGYLIVSTPKGIKTHVEARRERIGGEVICRIW